jgi:hypothetical protein
MIINQKNKHSKTSIRVRLTNINNSTDIIEYESIHEAMRKHKKSFQTIKTYISERKVINDYLWDTPSKEYHEVVENLTEPDIDIVADEDIAYKTVYDTEIMQDDNFIIFPEQILSPITEITYEDTMFDDNIIQSTEIQSISPSVQSKALKNRQPCSCTLM